MKAKLPCLTAVYLLCSIIPGLAGAVLPPSRPVEFDNPTALASANIHPLQTFINVIVMSGTPSSPDVGTCSLTYSKGTTSPVKYGAILNIKSGIYWEPNYNTSPREGCEYGMVGNNAFDNTTAFQAAVNDALASTSGGALHLSLGKFRITDTITIGPPSASYRPFHFSGTSQNISIGFYGTTIVWRGASSKPAISIQGMALSSFEDFGVYTPQAATAVIELRTLTGFVTTNNIFKNIGVNGGLVTPKGFQFVPGTAGDVNNDNHRFINVSTFYTTVAGWSLEGVNVVGLNFLGCLAYTANIGVATSLGTGGIGGSYIWSGGGGGGNAVADFQIGALTGDPMVISGVHTEDSSRFVQMVGGPTSGQKPLSIRDNDFSSPSTIASDGYAIVLNGAGPFRIETTRISGTPTLPKIKIDSSDPSVLTMLDNSFSAVGSSTQASVVDTTGAGPFTILRAHNHYRTAGGAYVLRTEEQTGSGALVQSISPALTTPNIGDATATTLATSSYVLIGSTTVALLPTCATGLSAARMYVTDSTATLTAGIGAIVAGAGTNKVPVGCDGTNWRIGG